jgi:hypothetical protein
MTIPTAICIAGCLLGLQIGAACSEFWPVIWQMIYIRIKPWQGYDTQGFNRILKHFALLDEQLTIKLNDSTITEFNTEDGRSYQAAGLFIPFGRNLYLDTRLLRSHKSVVKTLIHEICHWNQYVQGRLMGPSEKSLFNKDPVEKEADSFANAWIKTAMKVYRGEYENNKY